MSWRVGLTPEQADAASSCQSHARLLAGPGTGKTHVLVKRVVYLLLEAMVPLSRVLLLTFTRAAAAELRTRIQEGVGKGALPPRVSTLHSFALSTILQNHTATRLPQPIRIADDYEERWIVQEDLKRLMAFHRVRDVQELLHRLSSDWERLTPDAEDRYPDPRFLAAWREHREIYGYALRAELVYQLRQALIEGELVLEEGLDHVLVDEYQDLNACDLSVVQALATRTAKIFCAGDDDQSIYGFRYADPEGIRRFTDDFCPSTSVTLTECFRCDRAILQLGLHVAEQDTRRLPKQIRCVNKDHDGYVQILRFANQHQEAEGVAGLCSYLIHKRGVPPEEILILYRADPDRRVSSVVRDALSSRNIQATVVSEPMRVFNCPKGEAGKLQTEGRQFLSLLRLLSNPDDCLAWRTLLELRPNHVGPSTISAIYEEARSRGQRFVSAVKAACAGDILVRSTPTLIKAVQDIQGVVASARAMMEGGSDDFMMELAEQTITNDTTRQEVCAALERALGASHRADLSSILHAVNTSLGEKEQERQKGVVNLMTMHQAKGLSADAVVVLGAEDETVPGRAQGAHADDERRLLYVSITRARHVLVITHCEQRIGAQAHMGAAPGRPGRRLTRFLSGGPVRSSEAQRALAALGC